MFENEAQLPRPTGNLYGGRQPRIWIKLWASSCAGPTIPASGLGLGGFSRRLKHAHLAGQPDSLAFALAAVVLLETEIKIRGTTLA